MSRRGHRVLGLLLVLPMFGWAVTGLVFFVKPGYDEAYAPLEVATVPLVVEVRLTPDPGWSSFRVLATELGVHVLVEAPDGRRHLRYPELTPFEKPPDDALRSLIAASIAADPERYGTIVGLADGTARTDTGARIRIDWSSLSLAQSGRDTRWIDRLYKIHYLQWTGIEPLDRAVGMIGLVLVLLLPITGVRLLLGAGERHAKER